MFLFANNPTKSEDCRSNVMLISYVYVRSGSSGGSFGSAAGCCVLTVLLT